MHGSRCIHAQSISYAWWNLSNLTWSALSSRYFLIILSMEALFNFSRWVSNLATEPSAWFADIHCKNSVQILSLSVSLGFNLTSSKEISRHLARSETLTWPLISPARESNSCLEQVAEFEVPTCVQVNYHETGS